MARIRTVKPEFWTSEQVAECSTTTRLMFIGMWNFCDDGGNHVASFKQLKMQIFPSDEITISQIEGMVTELINNDLIAQYTVNNKVYWHVLGWGHQKIDKPNYKLPKFSETVSEPFDDRSTTDSIPFTPVREGNGMEGNGRELNKKENASEEKSEQAVIDKLTQGQFAKPDTFKMHFDWKPTVNFEAVCTFAGKDFKKFNDDILKLFIVHHVAEETYRTQQKWESFLLNWFSNYLAKPEKLRVVPKSQAQADFEKPYVPPKPQYNSDEFVVTPEMKAKNLALLEQHKKAFGL